MLVVKTYRADMNTETFVLSILAADHTLNVPLVARDKHSVEAVRRAVLAFAGFDVSEGET